MALFSIKKKIAIVEADSTSASKIAKALNSSPYEIVFIKELHQLIDLPKVEMIITGDSQSIPFSEVKKIGINRDIPILLISKDIFPKFYFQISFPCSEETICQLVSKLITNRQSFWKSLQQKKKKSA